MRKETNEVITSGVYLPPPGYYTFRPYWHMTNLQFYPTSSYLKENAIVSAEFNLSNTKDEKLLWSVAGPQIVDRSVRRKQTPFVARQLTK